MALEFSVWPDGAVEQVRSMAMSLSSVSGRLDDTEVAQLRSLAKGTVLAGFGDAEIAACVAEALTGLTIDRRETHRSVEEEGDVRKSPSDATALAASPVRPIRLAKISRHNALVLEVDPRTMDFVEYDPLRPQDTWRGTMEVNGGGHRATVNLSVGPYSLTAGRVLQDDFNQMTGLRRNAGHFRGTETGPHGDNRFDVFLLADDRRVLVDPTAIDFWLCFTAGTFTPVEHRSFPKTSWPSETIRHPERTRGATRFRVRSGDDRVVGDELYGGQTWIGRIHHWPKRLGDRGGLQLKLKNGGWAAGDWDLPRDAVNETLRVDKDRRCWRSAERVFYPTATRTDLIELVAQRVG